jgi:hypothetical protein
LDKLIKYRSVEAVTKDKIYYRLRQKVSPAVRQTAPKQTPQKYIPDIIVCAMLLWAICYEDNPYAYYQLLRVACFGVFAYFTFKHIEAQKTGWAWVFGIVALIYNPLFPFHFERDGELICWVNINWLTVALVCVHAIAKATREKKVKCFLWLHSVRRSLMAPSVWSSFVSRHSLVVGAITVLRVSQSDPAQHLDGRRNQLPSGLG